LDEDDNHSYDSSSSHSSTEPELEQKNRTEDIATVTTTTNKAEHAATFDSVKEASETSLSNAQVNEIQEILDDVTLDDVTIHDSDIVELSSTDNLAIASNFMLPKSDETSVISFDREISLEQESDFSYEDDWDVLTAAQSLKNNNSVYSMSEDGWDAISTVSSVVSLETVQSNVPKISYKDMVTKRGDASNVVNKQHNVQSDVKEAEKSSSTSSSAMIPIDENASSDIYHEYEGYKHSRGGKEALKFRGLNRHQRGRTTGSIKHYSKNYRKGSARGYY